MFRAAFKIVAARLAAMGAFKIVALAYRLSPKYQALLNRLLG